MTTMTPSEAFVETLVANGVKEVFGIVGSAFMDALDLFEPAGIRFVPTAHEQGAGHMADGFARASGGVGVCIAQNGPGISNFVTAIAAAYWAHSPVVCITPESGTATMGHGGFQEVEQLPFFEKITKWQGHVNRADRIAEFTGRAFQLARLERGPTQLNIPRDFFYGQIDVEIPTPLRISYGPGSSDSLDQAARILADAEFPVIISGGGVVMGGGVADCVALAEFLGAPAVASYLHNDAFPANHPLMCGPLGYNGSKAAMAIMSKADVILALGTRLGPFGTLPQYGIDYWPKTARIIQVDIDHRMLGLVKPVEVAILGDAGKSAAELMARLHRLSPRCLAPRDERKAAVDRRKSAWESERDSASTETSSPIAPRRALRELERALPEDAMVTTDIGNICSLANSHLRFNRPDSFFAAMSYGNCGYAYPTALGCKVARPDRPAIAYVGDGAWGMSLNEVLTAVRENIPAVAVVFNNGQWGAEKKNQIDYYANRFIGTNLANPSWAAVAQSMGADGFRIDQPDQVGDALRQACLSGRPTVLELMVTQSLGEPFRRDALKKPARMLDKYKAYTVA
ncbi:MAG: sulfoacetaldehyde acetyltransferase [Actinomycetota bacterium]